MKLTKRIFAILLTSTLTASALLLSSCGKNGDEQGSDDALTVVVTVVDDVNGKDILSYAVPYEENTTVLEYTVTACASNGINYELSDNDESFKSLDGLADYAYADTEESNYWHYLLNDHDGIDEADYAPSTKIASAGDVITWKYSVAVSE